MINNQWYAVASSKDFKKGRLYPVERMGLKLVFFRNCKGELHILSDRCPHRGASVGMGKVVNGHLQCPFHGIEFAEDGKCACVPAEGRKSNKNYDRFNLKNYPIREIGEIVFMWYGDAEPASEPPVFDIMTDKRFKYGHLNDTWNIHYSRVIENQLDVQHLAFVHHNTIGRGDKTLINGPKVVWLDENTLQTSANNEKDAGQVPRGADECSINTTNLTFKYPNLWMNTINNKIRILAYFIPVNEDETIISIRFYNRITGLGLIDKIIAFAGNWADLIVERQDKRVVEKQIPTKTALRIDERLLMADKPIIEYRRRREELQRS